MILSETSLCSVTFPEETFTLSCIRRFLALKYVLTHFVIKSFSFIASKNNTRIIVRQDNHRFTMQSLTNGPLTENEKVIAISEGDHLYLIRKRNEFFFVFQITVIKVTFNDKKQKNKTRI